MLVERLSLTDFRNYASAELELMDGITAVLGDNGQGKTNLAEALAYLATLESFRGAPPDALIRLGAMQAVVRATVRHDDGREILIEAEINRSGRNRVLVNKQRLHRARDLLGVLRVTVFAPDDLELVKGGPGERRRFLDDLLVALHPKHDQLRMDLERILRQRNTLLKQAAGRLTDEIAFTLDVWDSKLAVAGDALGAARHALVAELTPLVRAAYGDLAGDDTRRRPRLRPAVARGGPRRRPRGRPARRCPPPAQSGRTASRRRRAGDRSARRRERTRRRASSEPLHWHCGSPGIGSSPPATGAAPMLVLDDVLSELDPHRSDALLRHLPTGQVILTTAGVLPEAAHARRVLRIRAGTVTA